MFGLKQNQIERISQCFAQYPSIERVLVYGSRAIGNYKNGSDIDLAVVGELTHRQLLQLENQLDDLLLPYKIDLSLLRQISNPELLEHIQCVGEVLYEKRYPAQTTPPPEETHTPEKSNESNQ